MNGRELWRSDGTDAGTVLVQDINPGALGSELAELVNVNGELFFWANDGTNGKSCGDPTKFQPTSYAIFGPALLDPPHPIIFAKRPCPSSETGEFQRRIGISRNGSD